MGIGWHFAIVRSQADRRTARKAASGNPDHIGAPTPGLVTAVFVGVGDEVEPNAKLLTLEAMKMQSTIYAPDAGKIKEVLVEAGSQVQSKDLLLIMES